LLTTLIFQLHPVTMFNSLKWQKGRLRFTEQQHD